MAKTPAVIQIGHSPDSDDAFMFYALAEGKIATDGLRFQIVQRDVETLNWWAREGRLAVTAISAHAYAYVADRYAILTHGASMGDNYGPIVVAREPMTPDHLCQATIAIPGELTSAFLALRLCLGHFAYRVIAFDRIMEAVATGEADAGLLIHEGQLTHAGFGLHRVLDLGQWWYRSSGGLPLPLGLNAIRLDLGQALIGRISRVIRASIEYGLAHRDLALHHAMGYAKELDAAIADRYIGMYVNDWTRDFGPRGRASIERFFALAREHGLIPPGIAPRFVD